MSKSTSKTLHGTWLGEAQKGSLWLSYFKRHSKAWWSAEMKETISERRKVFAVAHRSDEDRQAYISASQRASLVIAKAKTEAWHTTCYSLSPKSNPISVYSLLRSVAGSTFSSSSSPNFPNCSSPREPDAVNAAYLKSHFSVSQSKALHTSDRLGTPGSGDVSLAIFITSVSGIDNLASFTNRFFHFSGPPGFSMAFDPTERNREFGRI